MRLIYIVLILILITGCSSQQAYSTGQAYQRGECNSINDNSERMRCMDAANMSYEEYQRKKEVK